MHCACVLMQRAVCIENYLLWSRLGYVVVQEEGVGRGVEGGGVVKGWE